MSNITYAFRLSIITCILSMIAPGICYAIRTVTPVIIKCSPTSKEAQWQKYKGKPGTILTLNTLGMKVVAEGEELIRFWDLTKYVSPNVPATCTPTKGPSSYVNMFPWLFKGYHSDIISPLTCAPGEGISVRLASPNCKTPAEDVYYYGELIAVSDDEAPQLNQVDEIPPPTQAMQIPNPTEQLVSRVGLPPSVMVGGSGTGGSPTK